MSPSLPEVSVKQQQLFKEEYRWPGCQFLRYTPEITPWNEGKSVCFLIELVWSVNYGSTVICKELYLDPHLFKFLTFFRGVALKWDSETPGGSLRPFQGALWSQNYFHDSAKMSLDIFHHLHWGVGAMAGAHAGASAGIRAVAPNRTGSLSSSLRRNCRFQKMPLLC